MVGQFIMLLLGESTCINATPGTAKCIYYNDAGAHKESCVGSVKEITETAV